MTKPRIVKRIIGFSEPSLKWMKRKSTKLGISMSELVRRAVDKWREEDSEVK